jgi:hypothetical protein
MPWAPEPETPLYIGRIELDYGFASPKGKIDEYVQDTEALRLGFGFNLSRLVSMSFGSRMFFVDEDDIGRDFYYFDLVSMGLRFSYDTGRRVTVYAGGEASLTGMSVPCDPLDPDSFCEPGTTEFLPRLGLHWRVGGTFAVTPGRFDVGLHVSGTKTIPDDAEWLVFGAGLVLHYGKEHPSTAASPTPSPDPGPQPGRRKY